MQLRRFDHVAIAVEDLERAVVLFQGILGGTFIHGGDDERLGIRTIQLGLTPGVKIELMTPIRPDSYLRRFLDRHGQGFHHATFLVDDVEKAVSELTSKGFEVVDTDLREPYWRETFVRPSSGFGTLLQIADTTKTWSTPTTAYTLQDVLTGRVVWRDDIGALRETSPGAEPR